MDSVNKIFDYFELYGECDYIGEPVTQIEHMVQAAMLAEKDNQPVEVILAALFHDIGHLIQQQQYLAYNLAFLKCLIIKPYHYLILNFFLYH